MSGKNLPMKNQKPPKEKGIEKILSKEDLDMLVRATQEVNRASMRYDLVREEIAHRYGLTQESKVDLASGKIFKSEK